MFAKFRYYTKADNPEYTTEDGTFDYQDMKKASAARSAACWRRQSESSKLLAHVCTHAADRVSVLARWPLLVALAEMPPTLKFPGATIQSYAVGTF